MASSTSSYATVFSRRHDGVVHQPTSVSNNTRQRTGVRGRARNSHPLQQTVPGTTVKGSVIRVFLHFFPCTGHDCSRASKTQTIVPAGIDVLGCEEIDQSCALPRCADKCRSAPPGTPKRPAKRKRPRKNWGWQRLEISQIRRAMAAGRSIVRRRRLLKALSDSHRSHPEPARPRQKNVAEIAEINRRQCRSRKDGAAGRLE